MSFILMIHNLTFVENYEVAMVAPQIETGAQDWVLAKTELALQVYPRAVSLTLARSSAVTSAKAKFCLETSALPPPLEAI